MDVTQLIAMTKLALEQQATINAKQAEIAAKLDTLIALTNAGAERGGHHTRRRYRPGAARGRGRGSSEGVVRSTTSPTLVRAAVFWLCIAGLGAIVLAAW
jgi:hypothetical protein